MSGLSRFSDELEILQDLEHIHNAYKYREVFERPDAKFRDFVYSHVPDIPQRALRGAKLYSDRYTLIEDLPKKMSIVEVGVALGDFSVELIRRMHPKYFGALDTFEGAVKTFG